MITLKRCLALVGLTVLMGATLHKKNPLAAASNSPLAATELTYARMDPPHPPTNSNFLDNINLSLNPPVEIQPRNLEDAGLNFQRDLPSGNFNELQPKSGVAPKRALTVADRKLNYELLGSKDMDFKFNLTPAYANPEATIPTSLDPGFGISIKF